MGRQRTPGGRPYRRSSDGLWLATVDLGIGPDGKRRRPTVSSKDYAEVIRKRDELRATIARHGDVVSGGMTVKDWLHYWVEEIAAPRLRPTTLASHRSDIERYIVPAIGRHRLDRLQPQHVRAMTKSVTDRGLSSTSALRCYRLLSKALSDALREQPPILLSNPAALVDAPQRAVSSRGALDLDQAVTVLRYVQDKTLGSLWAAALLTGARRGELLGLERDRVTTVLDLSWQLQRIDPVHGCGEPKEQAWPCGKTAGRCPQRRTPLPPGFEYRHLTGAYYLTRPKTRSGTRVIPLIDPLASILERHIAATEPGPHGLVWTTPKGGPLDPRGVTNAWRDMLAGLKVAKVPLHAARHTTATLLLEAGVDPKVIGAILGHSDVLTTRGYQHVDQRLTREALERLTGRLALDA